MKKKFYLSIIVFFVLLLIIGSFSFAYFTASVNGNNLASTNVITSGSMSLLLNDGADVSAGNLMPGSSVTKTFSVKNNGSLDTVYDIYLSEIINTLADKNDLVYRVTSSDGGCQTLASSVVFDKSSENSKIISSCPISHGATHSYSLTIEFINDDSNQDDNKGKKFSAKLAINSFKEGNYSPLDLMANNPNLVDFSGIDGANNYRFTGANPNNYVSFGGYDAGWRVVGIFDGYVKLVRLSTIGSMPIVNPGTTSIDWNNAYGINSIQSFATFQDGELIDNHAWCSGDSNGSSTYLEECLSTTTKKVGILSLNDAKNASSWLFDYYSENAPMWVFNADSSQDHSVWAIGRGGTTYSFDVSSTSPAYVYNIIPSVYLKNNVSVKGSGTIEDPYVFYTGDKVDYTYASVDSLKEIMSDYSSIDGEGIYRYISSSNNAKNYVSFNNERAAFRIVGIFGDNVKLVRLKKFSSIPAEITIMNSDLKPFGSSNDFASSSIKTYLDGLSVNDNSMVVSHAFGTGFASVDDTATYSQVMSSTINTKVGFVDLYDVQQAAWLKGFNGVNPYSWTITGYGSTIAAYANNTVLNVNTTIAMYPSYSVYLSKDVKVRGKGTENEPYVFVSTKEVSDDINEQIVPNMSDYSSSDGAGIYRYVGANPNNYVKLSDNSIWRIINVENGMPKIVKTESIGAKQWDSSDVNVWSTSSLSSYLNSNSFAYYSNSLVESHDYCVGKVLNPVSATYSDLCSTTWNGKIALPNAYEINQADWLKNQFGGTFWTLTGSTWNNSTNAVHIYTNSGFDGDAANDYLHTLVAMYLKPNLNVSGTGTEADPYVFSE